MLPLVDCFAAELFFFFFFMYAAAISFGHRKLHKHKCIRFILSTSVGLDEALFSIIKWSRSPCVSSSSPPFSNLIKIIP